MRVESDQLDMPSASCAHLVEAAAWCAQWLELQAACRDADTHLAAVFDIDATLVADDRRIEDTCRLYDLCHDLRITPFLVTARPEEGRAYTEEQMQRLGIHRYKRLFMHPDHKRCDVSGAGAEKLRARTRIEMHGYKICFNAGDACHDHFHPILPRMKSALSGTHVFVTEGAAHLKLP